MELAKSEFPKAGLSRLQEELDGTHGLCSMGNDCAVGSHRAEANIEGCSYFDIQCSIVMVPHI